MGQTLGSLAIFAAIRRASSRGSVIRFVERSAKLFDEFVSNQQIGKAPSIIKLPFLQNCTSVSRLNMSCFVKLNDPAAQRDIQPAHTGGKLGDVGELCFVQHLVRVGHGNSGNDSALNHRTPHVLWRLNSSGNLAMLTAIRHRLVGCVESSSIFVLHVTSR